MVVMTFSDNILHKQGTSLLQHLKRDNIAVAEMTCSVNT